MKSKFDTTIKAKKDDFPYLNNSGSAENVGLPRCYNRTVLVTVVRYVLEFYSYTNGIILM